MARREWKVVLDGAKGRTPKSTGFRRNPREHAGVGAIGQEKTPTENGWGVVIGGGGGNRTRVRKHSTPGTTCLSRCSISSTGNTACQAHRWTSLLGLTRYRQAAVTGGPVWMTPSPPAQARVGRGLGLIRRPERSCRRWQLYVCHWFYEVSDDLGMHQAVLRPPSKPGRPRLSASIMGATMGRGKRRRTAVVPRFSCGGDPSWAVGAALPQAARGVCRRSSGGRRAGWRTAHR